MINKCNNIYDAIGDTDLNTQNINAYNDIELHWNTDFVNKAT